MLAGPSPAARGEVGWYRETSAKQNAANAGGRPLARNRPPSMRDGPTVAVYNFHHAKEQALEDLHRDRGVVRLPDGSGCVASVEARRCAAADALGEGRLSDQRAPR